MVKIKLLFLREFFTPALGDVFPFEFERQQVSWTRLRILPDLNNVVVWMGQFCSLISKYSCPFTSLL